MEKMTEIPVMKKIWFVAILCILTVFGSAAERFIPWKSARIPVPEHFPTGAQVFSFIKQFAADHPDYVKLFPYGYSVNGNKRKEKNLIALEIRDRSKEQNINVLFNAGIHSREFITVYAVMEWLKNFSKRLKNRDAALLRYLQKVRLIVIPLLNPDGYEMARQGWNWRKNTRIYKYRSPQFSPNSFGVDLNRNFPKFFVGVPFSFHYTWGGAKPLSEPETRYLADYLSRYNLSLVLSLHSYGRYVAYPWWGTRQRMERKHLEKHKQVIKKMRPLMKTYAFRQGCPYPVKGNFGDWVFDKFKCLTFTIEIGDSFNPNLKTTQKWYQEIEKGITYLLMDGYRHR